MNAQLTAWADMYAARYGIFDNRRAPRWAAKASRALGYGIQPARFFALVQVCGQIAAAQHGVRLDGDGEVALENRAATLRLLEQERDQLIDLITEGSHGDYRRAA